MAQHPQAVGVEDQQITVLDVAASPTLSHETAPSTTSALTRELRLALVCYGGVSLAIYMHGITKELEKLVAASAAYERNQQAHEFEEESDTAAVYWSLLKQLETDAKIRTRVVVDVVSGTSAGGINGVFLAAAIARNRSQEPLRAMWMKDGDINRLLTGPRGLPLWVKLPSVLWSVLRGKPVLDGNRISGLLDEALNQMGDEQSPIVPGLDSLVGSQERIQLFVPITDFYGYDVLIPADDPRFIVDRTHRHVMQFTHDDRDPAGNQLSSPWNHALAFSARASSSFPGAFPPLSIEDYERAAKAPAFDSEQRRRLFAAYEFNERFSPDKTHFVDGGVLDNKPFATTVAAIKLRPAATEVDRRLIYVEPDPSTEPGVAPEGKAPGLVQTIMGGYAGIPRQEPIIGDLTDLAVHNTNVARIRDVIETSFEPIRQRVQTYLSDQGEDLQKSPTIEQVTAWRSALSQQAGPEAGFAYPTYVRLRIRAVIDDFARLIAERRGYPLTSSHALFIGQTLRELAKEQHLLDTSASATDAQRDLIETLDLAHHERHIRFLIAALGWWYNPTQKDKEQVPAREDLDHAKHVLYKQLDLLSEIARLLTDDDQIRTLVDSLFAPKVITKALQNPTGFVKERADDLAQLQQLVQHTIGPKLADLPVALDAEVVRLTNRWNEWARAEFLTRHIAFEFWDILVYPIEAVSGLNERDHVEVMRISPQETIDLATPEEKNLKGVTFGHFGAFFSRPGRENDYLWGRLDGTERLIALLLTPPGHSIGWTREPANGDRDHNNRLRAYKAACKAAAEHIIASETEELTRIRSRLEFVADRLASQG